MFRMALQKRSFRLFSIKLISRRVIKRRTVLSIPCSCAVFSRRERELARIRHLAPEKRSISRQWERNWFSSRFKGLLVRSRVLCAVVHTCKPAGCMRLSNRAGRSNRSEAVYIHATKYCSNLLLHFSPLEFLFLLLYIKKH